MAQKRVVTLHVHNRRNGPIFFATEPTGEVYRMPAGASYEVVSEEEMLEINIEEDLVSVWGDDYAVYREGVELMLEDQINIDVERKKALRSQRRNGERKA